MQPFFNGLSVASFTISVGVLIGSTMLYTRVPSMMKLYLSKIKLELTETILDQVPVPKMPELPKATGPAVELPKSPF